MKCSFCKATIRRGTGKMFVKNDGTIFYWCSSKCQKNFKLGRSAKKVEWVKKTKKSKAAKK